ncbi:MAG: HAD-IIB family hydrolase [Thermodesulfovibrionia bacterium]|nr:HAD-IIB family hydrolase [Thermodesulfovibrionia bacterium]
MDTRLIVFTDLDGTLLDLKYSFKKALPALRLLRMKNIPLVLCSSKTRAEIEYYRRKLLNTHPFISENGGGIFIPKHYFKFQISNLNFHIVEGKKYYLIKLGTSYSALRKTVGRLRSEGFDVRGFGDMDIEEIAELTGLKTREARVAKRRDFDEPFIFNGSKRDLKSLLLRIRSLGFNYTQGMFFHIMGNSDKGRAVEILKRLYMRQHGTLVTAALGDSLNDEAMFKKVDYPVLVKKHNGSYDKGILLRKLIKVNGIGPEGWNKAVVKLIKTVFF